MRMSVSRMLRLFCLLTTVFLVAVLLLVYAAFSQNLRDGAEAQRMQTFLIIRNRVQSQIEEIKTDVTNIANQEDIAAFLQGTHLDRFAKMDSTRDTLAGIVRYRSVVYEACLYRAHGAALTTGSRSSIGAYAAFRETVSEYRLDSVFRSVQVTGARALPQVGDHVFGVIAPVFSSRYNRTTENYLGAVIAMCSMQSLFRSSVAEGMPLWLIRDDSVLATNAPDLSGAAVHAVDGAFTLDGHANTLLSLAVDGTPWRLCTAYSDGDLMAGIEPVRRWGLVLIAGIVLSQAVLALLMQRGITNPIINIAQQTRRIVTTGGQVQNPAVARNELGQLTQGINSMLERVEQMNREVARSERVAYEANLAMLRERIMFLQTQINPHFLYNSLECVRGMAAEGENATVREMISLMASLYRYCTTEGHTVALADELDDVTKYFGITELRYRGRYTLSTDCYGHAAACLTPRMVLQPIIENAVLHGFAHANRQTGHIRLTASFDGDALLVRVEDDGAGMGADAIAVLNETLGGARTHEAAVAESKIGLHNVASRIGLLFGPDSGMRVAANERGGTTVELRIVQPPEGNAGPRDLQQENKTSM